MRQMTSRLMIFLVIISAAMGLANRSALALEFIILTPVHSDETKDFYNTALLEKPEDIKYFAVMCTSQETPIVTLTIKLSAAPTMKEYEGYVKYCLFVVGIPSIYFIDTATATDSTASSSSIKVDFPINATYGFAVVGAAVLSRNNVDDDVKMTLKCSVQ